MINHFSLKFSEFSKMKRLIKFIDGVHKELKVLPLQAEYVIFCKKINSEGYGRIMDLFRWALDAFEKMNKKNKWIENLNRFSKTRKDEPGFDNVLSSFQRDIVPWTALVLDRIRSSKTAEGLFKASYISGAVLAKKRLPKDFWKELRLKGLPLEESFALRQKIMESALWDAATKSVYDTIVDKFWNKGIHPDIIAKDLRSSVMPKYKNRARTIARTETNWAASKAQYDSFKKVGVSKKELVLAPDACEICVAAQAEFDNAPIDKEVADGFGEMVAFPPFHPNCRCAVVPVIE